MQRYRGEPLGSAPKVAVLSNDALGNYVVVTPLLQMLREQLSPSAIHYYGGTRTEEFWSQETLIDRGFSLFGSDPSAASAFATKNGPYDLVVNVESSEWAMCFSALLSGPHTYVVGPCLASSGRSRLPLADDEVGRLAGDPEWMRDGLAQEYGCLRTGFIGEIFCRLAYLRGEVPKYKLPSNQPACELPDVLIAMSASLPEKLWPIDKWIDALTQIKTRGLKVGLLGAKPSAQSAFWTGALDESRLVELGLAIDLRGEFSLPQVVGALASTRRVLTLDNGVLHMAASTETPTVGLFRHGIHRLWAPPAKNVTVMTPETDHLVSDIEVKAVVEALVVGI